MRVRVLLLWLSLCPTLAWAGQAPAQADGIDRFVSRLDQAIASGDAAALRALATTDVHPTLLNEFVSNMTTPRVTAATVKERDRAPFDSGQQRLLLEILTERGGEGSVSTWRFDVRRPDTGGAGSGSDDWQFAGLERLTYISGLYRLALEAQTEYDVKNLTVSAPDFTLTLPTGQAFVAVTPAGPTAVVLLGRGRMQFAPKPEAERGQVHIFSGADAFATDFEAVFVRLNPGEFAERVPADALTRRAVNSGDLRHASQVFETYLPKTFQIDLSDLSAERWSLLPSSNDLIAEVVTRKYGTLTYTRSNNEAEDISFFDRKRRRNIAVYASDTKLKTRGRFYSEDTQVDYDVTHYDLHVAFAPDRLWVDGTARMVFRARTPGLSTMTVRLAESLVVRSVSSPRYGRLLHLRVVGQNSVLIGLPTAMARDEEAELVITYGGRLEPQGIDREAIEVVQRQELQPEAIVIPVEPQYVYSNRSYWYPQSPVTDYATASLTLTVPAEFGVIASGALQGSTTIAGDAAQQRPRKRYVFLTTRPARYLACIISRFHATGTGRLDLPSADVPGDGKGVMQYGGGADPDRDFKLTVQANPREFTRARGVSDRAADILTFYTSIVGETPYSSFTVALTESDLPGGHSPAYFAILNQPQVTSPVVWQNDPVSFENYPNFFLAHEVAHQWWGQAVGWKNYHEQWLSEGFAQYFAALYAERDKGQEQFTNVMRRMRKWALEMSPQGPIYLGYRLGHIRGESRVFRAVVYDKGAIVLHMLRRLVGDKAFFAGLRDFYTTWRYKKAGTDDFRASMEQASGRPLERFFDGWIYGSAIPRLRFSYTAATGRGEAVVHFEQRGEQIFDLPVTVTLLYADGSSGEVVVAVTDRIVEQTLPLKGTLRSVEVNRDGLALAEIDR